MPNFPQPCKAVDFSLGYSCLGFMGLAGKHPRLLLQRFRELGKNLSKITNMLNFHLPYTDVDFRQGNLCLSCMGLAGTNTLAFAQKI